MRPISAHSIVDFDYEGMQRNLLKTNLHSNHFIILNNGKILTVGKNPKIIKIYIYVHLSFIFNIAYFYFFQCDIQYFLWNIEMFNFDACIVEIK